MPQQPPDVVEGRVTQLILLAGAEERVLATLEETLMHVHPVPVVSVDGLGHEGGVKIVVVRDLLHHETEEHGAVGRAHRIRVLEINLVLSRGHLVVRGLHLDSHALQGVDDVPARALTAVHRRQIEIAATVVGA